MTFGLVLGGLDLIDTDETYTIETLAEGTEWGNPQPVEVAIRHLLQDGSIVEHERDDNREISLRVIIGGSDGVSLAEGEAALLAELYKRNTLTLTPPDGFGAPTVFDVLTSSLAHITDDLAEVLLSERHFSIRLVCEPFGRSATEVTIAALAVSGSTTTLVDAGSSTSGWASPSGSVSVVSGAVSVTTTAQSGSVTVTLIRTGSITTSSTKYLQVDWKNTAGGSSTFSALGDGVPLPQVASEISPTAGYTRTTVYVAAASVAVLTLNMVSAGWKVAVARNLTVDNINRTDVRPSIGTTRQQLRSIEVAGSVRSPGRLALEHPTSALGDAIVYTFEDLGNGYVPALRPYRVTGSGGTVTSDSAMISGAREPLTGGVNQFMADIPNPWLTPGRHILVARMSAGTAGVASVSYNKRLYIGASFISSTSVLTTVAPTLTTGYTNVVLGAIDLPLRWPATTGSLRLVLSGTGASASTITLDDAWLFNITVGKLTMVSCGTAAPAAAGSSNRLWIDSATVDDPIPNVSIGYAADRSDATYAAENILSFMEPEFMPPATVIFTVTSNALAADASLAHYPHYHTHAVA